MTLEAVGEFPFEFYIEKALPTDESSEEDMVLEGVASTTNVDHDHERMSKEAIASMANIINKEGVPLRVEHSKENEAVIGKVFKAWVDERNQLHIQARLDKGHVVSPILYRSMKNGSKMGFSVGGIIKHAAQEFSEKLGKVVKTFYDVALQEVSVTPRPANFDSWAIAKSLAGSPTEAERLRKTQVYESFLFENKKLDYLQVFAKSIPDEAWRKSASQFNHMAKDTKKTETETERDTEKAVSREDLRSVVKAMTEGFKSIYSLMENMGKMSTDAKDQVNPDEDKTEQIGDETHKMDTDAKDQVNPDEDKTEQIGDETAKTSSEADGTDLTGEREKKARKTESSTDTDTETTKTSSETDTDTDTYDLKTVKAMTKSFQELGFRFKTSSTDTETETTKTSSDTETETETKTKTPSTDTDTTDERMKAMHPIDRLVFTMAETMKAMAENMEKTGMRIPGFEREFIGKYQNDPVFQKHVQELMTVPGFKKSVSFGTAYVPTKDGGRLPLTLTPAGAPTIEKSKDAKGKSFSEVYKTDFSSLSHLDES